MNKEKIALVITLIAIVAIPTIIVCGLISYIQTVQNQGTKVTYSGPGISVVPLTLDWGDVHEGDIATKTLTIENQSPYSLTLSMTTQNMTPAGIVDLVWNIPVSYVLSASTSVVAEVTLTVSPEPVTADTPFSFNLVITGTETTQ